jgi:sulfite dehydrogenase (quinone) subunit SoeC
MHPAFSLIFFTAMAGMAQGMVMSLLVLHLAGNPLPNHFMNYLAFPIILLLLAGGLLASFFHLGHPERAWRAILMWRTSWLSREVLVMPSFIALSVLAYIYSWQLGSIPNWLWLLLGIFAVLLWVCTAMIYQCIRFIQEWAHPVTMVNFIALGFASGWFLLMTLFAIWSAWLPDQAIVTSQNLAGVTGFTGFLLMLSLTLKLWIWKRNRSLKPKSSLRSATGIQQGPVRQISMGMMGGSFNTREFFHRQSNFFVANVRKLAFFGAYLIPVTLLVIATSQASLNFIIAAFLVHLLGLMAERWLFFAESNHPQNLYYQRIA